jgi:hypothetical protein
VWHIEQQCSYKPVCKIIWQIDVLALDVRLAIAVRRACGRRTPSGFHSKVGWLLKKRSFLNVVIAYQPKRIPLPICRHLIINRPIHEVIRQPHRDFIAMDHLPEFTTG